MDVTLTVYMENAGSIDEIHPFHKYLRISRQCDMLRSTNLCYISLRTRVSSTYVQKNAKTVFIPYILQSCITFSTSPLKVTTS